MTKEQNTPQMSDQLKRDIEQMSPFKKKYAEYRAQGLKQADAAWKAGSTASDRKIASRTGYNTEQEQGVKDYIEYLMHKRASQAMVDSIEIIDKLRTVYEEAIANNKFNDANKAAELLGSMIGAFDTKGNNSNNSSKEAGGQGSSSNSTKNDVNAFKQEDLSLEEKRRQMKKLLGTTE